jgi:superfamily II DNA or RNA helicase
MNYTDFISNKFKAQKDCGFELDRNELNPKLFEYQKDLVLWGLRRGKSAFFAGTGTGKTFMQCEWAKHVYERLNMPVLILSPLAVSAQTVLEAQKLGIDVKLCAEQADIVNGVNITNYEKLDRFDATSFGGIVLDESSMLKSFTSATRNDIIESFNNTPFRLACTATPAPNDFMELGNHSEFLDAMTRTEMLSMFFYHDGGDTAKWRLKGHAEDKFWEFVASWAAILTMPSDLGYDNAGFELPPLNYNEIVVKSNSVPEGCLFAFEAQNLQERRANRKATINERVKVCADIVNSSNDIHLVWCDLNAESELLKKSIKDCVEVKGSDSPEHKEKAMLDFAAGKIKCLVSKPSICGFGLNFQVCHNMSFVGLSDSFEEYYQAVRRCYRFGQTKSVNVNIITSELEGAVVENIKRKERDSLKMHAAMVEHTKKFVQENTKNIKIYDRNYNPKQNIIVPSWI